MANTSEKEEKSNSEKTNSEKDKKLNSDLDKKEISEKIKKLDIDKKANSKKDKRLNTEKKDEENSGQKWLKYGDFTLSLFDKSCIESDIEWLTDTIMNAVQHILKAQFPQIKGLQNVLLNQIQEFVAIEPGSQFVQILNDNGEHWIVLSNVMVQNRDKHIKIYDSKSFSDAKYTMDTKNAIFKLMSRSEKITIEAEYVSQQEDANQCGLYAIAFAHMLCAGEDPSTILFSNSPQLLRKHLMKCFERGEICKFPTGNHTIIETFIL
jgi:hypothetical protein